MKSNRYTAAEIAEMGLPGLPRTKSAIITRADREQWEFELVKGLGGTRRLYFVPEQYLTGTTVSQPTKPSVERVAGTIAAGSSKVDPAKLELAIRALSEWEIERNVKVDPARRPAVIAILYDYLQNSVEEESQEAMSMVLRALG